MVFDNTLCIITKASIQALGAPTLSGVFKGRGARHLPRDPLVRGTPRDGSCVNSHFW